MGLGVSYAALYQGYLDNFDPTDNSDGPMSYDEYLDMVYSESEGD